MQNYIIFNKYNKISITKTLSKIEKNPNDLLITCNSNNLSNYNFTPFFNNDYKHNVFILCDDISTEEVFSFAIKDLKFVKAAGGIVINEQNEILFMYRNKVWDLPKGHWEEGETIEQTAKREVMEECGMLLLEEKQFLTKTFHTYIMNNVREIKETSWFKMFCDKSQILHPQTIEGITDLKWVNRNDIPKILEHSYPSVRQLFKEISGEL